MFSFTALVFAIAVGILGGSFLLARYIRNHGLFFPEPYPSGFWNTEALDPQPEEFSFLTSDGVRLGAWLFKTPVAEGKGPFIIWFHGNAGNITHRGPVAAEMARRGATVMLFDYRGFGRSEGSPSERSVMLDAEAAWSYATGQLSADRRRIVLYGESIGGPYAAFVAARHVPCAVIIENSIPSLKAAARVVYPHLPLNLVARDGLTTTRWLNEAGAPVLVMHGRRDTILPFQLGEELFDSLRVPKRFFVSDLADHDQIPDVEGPRYYDAVFSFVHERCTGP